MNTRSRPSRPSLCPLRWLRRWIMRQRQLLRLLARYRARDERLRELMNDWQLAANIERERRARRRELALYPALELWGR